MRYRGERMRFREEEEEEQPKGQRRLEFYVDGSGASPFSSKSGYAYCGERRRCVIWKEGLTNNQAEYRGFLLCLKDLESGSKVTIYTDSQVMCGQFKAKYSVRDPKLAHLLGRVREVIVDRDLDVNLVWVPREQNRAGRLLDASR